MSAHKNIDRICVFITVIAIVIALIFCNGTALGVQTTAHATGYENRLFDHSRVHTIDVVINDWDGFIEGCENEEYTACNVVIDGESVKNVGLRAKGNTSLSSVKNMNSSRYSFKIEFDHYENGKSYHGLDKLCLNNIIQDNTYMKDYLSYTLMYDFGVDAPLCSYAFITVNGEDWGLYLAVEAIEEAFLERNYGSNYGDLYKPDATGFGGGRGNGRDFSMGDLAESEGGEKNAPVPQTGFGGGMPDFGDMPQFDPENVPEDFDPESFDPSGFFGSDSEMHGFGGGGMGMGSDDVKLNYTGDDPDSYSNIFNNAKTPVDKADKKRLISSLKALKEQSDIESTVDVEEVIRYFAVHDFLVNGDSYTGQMIHNYYLYEKNGQLSMIPWDYNLAFGTFQGSNASSSVNSPIDTPVSGDMSDRPMVSWIFDNGEYTEQYHQLFGEFIGSVDFEKLVADTAALIDKYVEKDPTKFCTYEEFKTGVEAISKFCTLRAESIKGQLEGIIPSTADGQDADSSALVDTDGLNISDMGTMNKGGIGKDGDRDRSGRGERSDTKGGRNVTQKEQPVENTSLSVSSLNNMQLLADEEDSEVNGKTSRGAGGKGGFNGTLPDGVGGGRPDMGGQPPQDLGGEMPEGFEPGNVPEGLPNGGMQGSSGTDSKPDSAAGTEQSDSGEISSGGAPQGFSSDSQASGNEGRFVGRPDMGVLQGSQPTDNKTSYIMLGVSAIVLLLGLGFAFRFRR